MDSEKSMTESESLDLIQRMINSVKEEMEDDSFYYLLWGWLVFIASMTHYVLLQLQMPYEYMGWIILMPLGGIASGIYGRNQEKKQRVKTYIDALMKYVLITFMVCLLIVLFFQFKLQLNTYPMVMMVYGMWLFISGSALRFRPLIIGGIVNWVLCLVSFFFPFETQLLILAGAVLLGYIIPGHMLKARFQRKQTAVRS